MKMKLSSFLLPFWYPFILKTKVSTQPQKNWFFSKPFLVYNNKHNNFTIHSDICPHQGASLSKGHVDQHGLLNCPYHGFQFEDGWFYNIPTCRNEPKKKKKTKLKIPSLQTYNDTEDELIFVSNQNDTNGIPPPFQPIEENDSSFRGISGTVSIPTNYLSVCENLLDMLHISYVHSFGSKQNPLPTNVSFEAITEFHGKSTFLYKPHPNTISGVLGNQKEVIVENEYILPTNTLTRVTAGKVVKTVFTRSIPVSETETLLYWKIYRNFLTHPIFDFYIKFLMEKTLEEDVFILKHVYSEHRQGPLRSRFDKTIIEFRKACQKFQET